MKPSDVAHLLKMGGSTVRKWSSEFREYLSPTAVGGDDRRRDFTPQDVQILAVIKLRIDHNTPRAEINAELRRLQAGDWRELPPLLGADAQTDALASMPSADTALAFNVERRALLREVATMQIRIDQLEAKLDAERADKEKLLRELADMNGQLQRAQRDVELYEQGRLKPSAK